MIIELAGYIDHTYLKPFADEKKIFQLCKEAKMYNFKSVCIPPCYVVLAANELKNTKIDVTTVVGFPLGYQLSKIKTQEAMLALEQGAQELDMVINLCDVKNKHFEKIEKEILHIRQLGFFILKVILETAYLEREEMQILCTCAVHAGADFVKTSTGFAPLGATQEDVAFLRRCVGAKCGVKASGSIATKKQALEMIQAGATRIGTSHGIEIVTSI